MTLKEKIGQLFMLGFRGTTPSRSLLRFIREYHVGGVILFARNLTDPAQTLKLCNALQAQSPKMPLFIAIDQEGGEISRLPKGFTIFPGPESLAAGRSTEHVYRTAEATARELRAVGINMNLAPVLDVNTNAENPIIGKRSFGANPTTVSTFGLTMIAGFQDNYVISCGKHFPGHGDTDLDSHKALPVIKHGIQRLRDVELRPFLHAIENGLSSMMTAHVRYQELDPKEPATFSKRIITALLREGIGYSGIVITDDLEMKAVTNHYGPGEAAVKAIEAGVDLVLFCSDESAQLEALEAVAHAVKRKKISEGRIEQSLLRLLQIKENYLLPYRAADPAKVKAIVGCPTHKYLLQELREIEAASSSAKTV